MGTPDFAAVILRKLLSWEGGRVSAVYTQPDRPAGRGNRLKASAVKEVALEYGLPLYQPLSLKGQAEKDELAALKPDILAVAAYGLLLPEDVLSIPRLAPINVHGSILPAYRGAAPIQRAIMDGCTETGISIMHMRYALDAGPVYASRAIPTAGHTAQSMHDALAELGADMLIEVLNEFAEGRVPTCTEQDEALATYARKISKADGYIDWSESAECIDARIRGVTPWPGAQADFVCGGREPMRVIVESGHAASGCSSAGAPGDIVITPQSELGVATGSGLYIIDRVRPSGRKSMDAAAFRNGYVKEAACLRCPQA